MFRSFQAPTADDLWRQAAAALACDGGDGQSSRAGATREILHASLFVADPRQRWVYSRRPILNVAFALAEVVWMMRGRNDAAFLNYFNRQLPLHAGHGSTYHGAYGQRLRAAFGLDQLERAYLALRHQSDSRQVVLQLWDPRQDFPDPSGRAASPDVPCNVCALLKVRGGRLEWTQIMRSNDLHLGLPHNLVQFTSLQEILAGWLGLEPAGYHHLSDSLHVYERAREKFRVWADAPALPPNTDRLALPKPESDAGFATLESTVERIISPRTAAEELLVLASADVRLAPAFANMRRVFCAEGVRRRARRDLAERIMADCTNAAFCQLYTLWLERTAHPVPA